MLPDWIARRLTVPDASVLINYLGLGRFDLLAALLLAALPRDLVVTTEVAREIRRNRADMSDALAAGRATNPTCC